MPPVSKFDYMYTTTHSTWLRGVRRYEMDTLEYHISGSC